MELESPKITLLIVISYHLNDCLNFILISKINILLFVFCFKRIVCPFVNTESFHLDTGYKITENIINNEYSKKL